jgi:hypothetical protein
VKSSSELVNAIFSMRYAHGKTRLRTPPQARRKDAINDNSAYRTRVRAKMRVVKIRKHSREEMKRPAELAFHKVGLTLSG